MFLYLCPRYYKPWISNPSTRRGLCCLRWTGKLWLLIEVLRSGVWNLSVCLRVSLLHKKKKKNATYPEVAFICLSVHQCVLDWCSTQFHSLSKTQSAASFSPNPAPVLLVSSQHLLPVSFTAVKHG